MARPNRIDGRGYAQHVMNRGHDAETLFRTVRDHEVFLDLVGELPERFRMTVHGYALVRNHYHLKLTSSGQLSRAMQWLCGRYAQHFRAVHGGEGAVFKGRFHNVVIEQDLHWQYLEAYLAYQRRDEFAHPKDDPWTSYRALAGFDAPPDWLDASIWRDCGGPEGYRALVQGFADGLDPNTFIADIEPPTSKVAGRESVGATISRTAAALGKAPLDLLTRPGQGRPDPDGTALAWALVYCADLTHEHAGRVLGISAHAVNKRLVRLLRDPTAEARAAQSAFGR